MTKIINLIGAPGSGKSVLRAYLYHRLKIESIKRIEEVTEFAKDLVYENPSMLNDQLYVTAEQNRRLQRLLGKVDVVVNDSPIILGAVYNQSLPSYSWTDFVFELFDTYNNINILLSPINVQSYGRVHDSTQSEHIHDNLVCLLKEYNVQTYKHVDNEQTYNYILKRIEEYY